MFLQKQIDRIADWIATHTATFVQTLPGKLFLGISLIGPITFLPTLWEVWTGPNIDAFRTATWPLMVVVNVSVFLSLCHKGDWQVRLSMIVWIIFMLLTWIATLVR